MALELGESLLENMLGLNVSTDSDEEEPLHMGDCRTSSLGDEFFHSKSEYGVSEYHACKRLLYSTVGDSNEKVWDIFLLLPSFVFLVILGYSSPRTRQQLAKAPSILPKTLHLLILTATAVAFLRSLLLLALPTHSHSDGVKDKVGWTICRSIGFSLDLCCLLSLAFPSSSSSTSTWCPPGSPTPGASPGSETAPRHPTKRYLQLLAASALVWGIFTLVLELAFPTKEFHVFSTCSSLYGEGGGLFTGLTALLLSFLYLAVLGIRLVSPLKPHSMALLFLLLGLVTHLLRALGGFLLFQDVPAGICLTALTMFIQVTCLPPFAWFCLLRPLLGIGFLNHGGYRRQMDGEWIEDDDEEDSRHWRDLDDSPQTTNID